MPAGIRQKLGVGPGSTIEWHEEDGKIVVRKAGQYTFEDIHKRLFPNGPPKRRSLKELKEGVAKAVARHYAGR